MAYIIHFTNSLSGDANAKDPIVVEDYKLDGPVGPNDATATTNPDLTPGNNPLLGHPSTSILLYGRGSPNYGERIQENLIHLMEHFYSDEPPVFATAGEVWFDYGDNQVRLRAFDGTDWFDVTRIYADSVPPIAGDANRPIMSGQLWYDTNPGDELEFNEAQLKVWDGVQWISIAANYVKKTGDTMSGDLNMGVHRITNMDDPINLLDGTNKQYTDTKAEAEAAAVQANLDTHSSDATVHLTANQNAILDTLDTFAPLLDGTDIAALYDWDEFNAGLSINDVTSAKVDKAGDTMSGNLIMGLNQVKDVSNPTDPQDVVTKNYGDTNYLSSTSSTLSGNLDANSFNIVNLADPTNPFDAMNLQYADANYVALTGSVMSGNLDMNTTHAVIGLADPVNVRDAVNLQFLNAQLGSLTANNIGFTPTATLLSTDVQAAIVEAHDTLLPHQDTIDPVVTDDSTGGYFIGSHWVNTTSNESFICVDDSVGAAVWVSTTATTATTAASVAFTPAGNIAATNVQAALQELDTEKAATSHVHLASAITVTPAGNIASTDVQAALEELDAEKEPAFSKNTGFNLNLGTTAGTVSEGDHNHDADYVNITGDTMSGVLNMGSNKITSLATPTDYSTDAATASHAADMAYEFQYGQIGSAFNSTFQDSTAAASSGFGSVVKTSTCGTIIAVQMSTDVKIYHVSGPTSMTGSVVAVATMSNRYLLDMSETGNVIVCGDVSPGSAGTTVYTTYFDPETDTLGTEYSIAIAYRKVRISGNGRVLVVGDGYYTTNVGRVRWYNRADITSGWTYVTQSVGAANQYHGMGIAVDYVGHTAVGSTWAGLVQAGEVEYYRYTGTTWTLSQTIHAYNYSPSTNDWFGFNIALSGDGSTMVVSRGVTTSAGLEILEQPPRDGTIATYDEWEHRVPTIYYGSTNTDYSYHTLDIDYYGTMILAGNPVNGTANLILKNANAWRYIQDAAVKSDGSSGAPGSGVAIASIARHLFIGDSSYDSPSANIGHVQNIQLRSRLYTY